MEPDTPITIPKRVLCIEDEHFISELYVRALTKAGYEVDVQLDGIQGLAAAQTDSYDIILLDLMIPGITGIEVLRSLLRPTLSSAMTHAATSSTKLMAILSKLK